MQNQLPTKHGERALRERAIIDPDAECYLPAQIEVGPVLRFFVGNPIVALEQLRHRYQARRHTRTPVVSVIQLGELLISEKVATPTGKKAIEAVPTNEAQIQMVCLEQAQLIRTLPKHPLPSLAESSAFYQTDQANKAFRPHF
jgi:hypothetical protein